MFFMPGFRIDEAKRYLQCYQEDANFLFSEQSTRNFLILVIENLWVENNTGELTYFSAVFNKILENLPEHKKSDREYFERMSRGVQKMIAQPVTQFTIAPR